MINNPMYSSMPVYEQIPPRYVPQTNTTIIDEIERSTQQCLDASDPTCDNHQANHLSNYYVQNDFQLLKHNDPTGQIVSDATGDTQLADTTKTFEHNDPTGQIVSDATDDTQLADTTKTFEHNDPTGQIVSDATDDTQLADTTNMFEHNDPIDQSVDDTADASPASNFHPNLTPDTGINNSNCFNYGREPSTEAVASAASVTEIKQDHTEALDTNDHTD
jgi:hypothetical protein